jgi:asparagine synthase (glutamine-hydrolysing)
VSGFLVLVRTDGREVSVAELEPPLLALRGRGPHGSEYWAQGSAGVILTRFVSHDGETHQRIVHLADDGRLAGQVRLDDRASLIAAVGGAGRQWDDAALLGALLDARRGSPLPAPLGDYSVATVHPASAEIVLRAWRDPLGVRPLYYVRQSGYVAASNTIAALLALPDLPDALDLAVVGRFLDAGGFEDRERTWYREIRRVPAGHVLTVDRSGSLDVFPYWTPPVPELLRVSEQREYPERFRDLLGLAVRDRIRSPSVTVLMSGGLDSTALAGVAAGAVLDGAKPITAAVSACYHAVVRSDETEYARLAARALGIRLTEIDADSFGYLERPHIAAQRLVPPGEPDLALWVELLQEAARHGAVALAGFDGDALLTPPGIASLVRRQGIPRIAMQTIVHWSRFRQRPHLAVRGLLRARPVAPPAPWPWLRPEVVDAARSRAQGRTMPSAHPTCPEMWEAITDPVWEHVFASGDIGATGVLVDVRYPFMDRRLVEFALAVPPIPWLQRKQLLREAVRGVLPDRVRRRPKTSFEGYFEGRLAQVVSRRGPSAHTGAANSAAIGEFVDLGRIPSTLPILDVEQSLALLRVRELNDWLLAREAARR